jgi:hypothetical protein
MNDRKNISSRGGETVAVMKLKAPVYPAEPPFNPSTAYPEYPWGDKGPENYVYDGVREMFHLQQLDEANYGMSSWNPLGHIIKPGNRVIIKPNFYRESHWGRQSEWKQIITHGSVIRAVLDYVLIALKNDGEVYICDGPQLDSDWEEIVRRTGVGSVVEYCSRKSEVPVHLLDLRDSWHDLRAGEGGRGVIYSRNPLPGDQAGSCEIDLDTQLRPA